MIENGNRGSDKLYDNQQIVSALNLCQKVVVEASTAPFLECMESLSTQLMDFAETAITDAEQARYFELHNSVKIQSDPLEQAFRQVLLDHFSRFKEGKLQTRTGEEKYSKDMLSLVDNEDLEETIAISSINRVALDDNAEQLWCLAVRLGAIRGLDVLPAERNPISPVQFCEALRQALAGTDWDTRIKILAYRTFNKIFIPTLADLYQSLNHNLVERLGMPSLDFSVGGQSSAPLTDIYTETEQTSIADSVLDDTLSAGFDVASDEAGLASPLLGHAPNPAQATEQYQSHLFSAIRVLQNSIATSSAAPQGPGGQQASAGAMARTMPVGAAGVPQGQFIPGSTGLKRAPGEAAGTLVPTSQGFVPGRADAPVFNEQQLLTALQNLQAGVSEATSEILNASLSDQPDDGIPMQSVSALVQQFSEELLQTSEHEDQAVDNNDLQIIDLVGMLFDYMLSDDNLPNSIKTLLSYLHTPFLKTAFLDPGFFESTDHPARLLLNSLAESGCRWVSNDGTAQYEIYPRIRGVVQRVLDDFDNDIRIYAELLLEFSSYTKKIARRQELLERRATEKIQGEERLREMKIKVNQAVSQRISHVELPSAVLLLLLQPWSDYLVFVLLRHGDASPIWSEALKTIDDVVWSVQAKSKPADRAKQLELQDSLVQRLDAGFETIAYDQNKIKKLCDALFALQKMALQSRTVDAAPRETRDKLEMIAAKKAGISEMSEGVSEEEQRMVDSLKMIEFGTWFEFSTGRRLKVAWYNSTVLQYMLVDQMGKKVAMKSGLELAREMLSGEAKVISGSTKPFFERALENIYHSLNAQAETLKSDNDEGEL